MTILSFLDGATAAGCLAVGLFFLKFWRESRDRLFLAFSLALWILALDYTVLGAVPFDTENRAWAFSLRLVAFGLIVIAIADKNRRPR